MPRRRKRGLRYFPKGPLLKRLDAERRELIASAPTEHVERDGPHVRPTQAAVHARRA
jgi:hypothetical protein